MKPRLVLGCVILLSGALVLGAEEAGPAILLRGVVAFSTNKLALLEATGLRDWRGEMILAEGEREGDTEVLEIVPTIGKVKIKNGGIVSEIGFSTDLPAEAWVQSSSIGQRAGTLEGSSFLRLQQAGPSQLFGVYQLLAGRSLIRPQSLSAFRLDVGCKGTASTEELVKAIEQALALKGILFRQDRDKFVLAGREADLNSITPQLWELAVTLAKTRRHAVVPATEEELLPAGTINFPATDVRQVLMIYQELINRTLLRPGTLPAITVGFRSYTPWTVSEAIYAFNASLAMNGFSVRPVGEKFLFVFPTPQTQKMESLLTRQMQVHPASGKEPLAAGAIDLPGNRGLRQVMAVYQELCRNSIEIEPGLREIPPFIFKNQTPLAAEEVLHALDLLLAWNGLEVTQDDGKGLKLIQRSEAK